LQARLAFPAAVAEIVQEILERHTLRSLTKLVIADFRKRARASRDQSLERKARWARQRSNAVFVGITGSSAKSTAAALLSHILSAAGLVQQQVKFNNRRSILKTIARTSGRSNFVVVEAGIGESNRMEPMAELLQPDVAVVTMVGIEHKSVFGTHDAIAREKGHLVAALRPDGLAVLNGDDPFVRAMGERSKARVIKFGRSDDSDYIARDVHSAFPGRLRLTVEWPGGSVLLRTNFVGDHFWLPTLAAVATAIELEVPPVAVADRVASFKPLLERCGVISTPGGPSFILDTTKAPWHSIKLAFDTLANATAPRKRIVLGHMSDFAGSDQKYRDAYRWGRTVADQVIFVGNHSHRSKASEKDRELGCFMAFRTPEEVSDYIRSTAVADELILLKGSVDLHLERIALSWKHDVKCWVKSCGHNSGCVDCGRYEDSYTWHKGRKKRRGVVRLVNSMVSGPSRS
jgi:UDP-N-acetylmuramoyl-tripeptide--D-alanyl-D-alanine ligase